MLNSALVPIVRASARNPAGKIDSNAYTLIAPSTLISHVGDFTKTSRHAFFIFI